MSQVRIYAQCTEWYIDLDQRDVVVRQAREQDEGPCSTEIGLQRQMCDIELLRTASVHCEAATHLILQMLKRADQHALGTTLRIFEAEFLLVPSQMPPLPDW